MHAPRAVSAILLLFALTAPSAGQGLYLGPQPANPQPANPRPRPHHQAPRRPHRPLVRVTELRVKAEIVDGVATTELRQVFRNDGPRVAEGTWILPLPNGAAADRFTMTVGGVETAGEILDANKARRIYEQIVRQQRDPGLLEYTGSGCLRARIFPIPAHGEVPVLVRYRQVLPATGALHAWSYPLRAAGGGGMAPERMSLEVHVRSTTPLRNVYSPLPGVAIRTIGEHEARVSYEGASGRLPERDPAVFYGLSEEEFGLHLLTHRASSHGAGTFLMLLSPKQEWADTDRIRKEITFVLDTSGSMKGPKIAQARDALRFFIRSLRPSDRFNVVPFSTEARPFFAQPMAADEAHREVALAKVDAIEARGGTNIEDALRAALQPPAAPGGSDGGDAVSILLFLTDGLPTVGNTDIEQLLAAARQRNSHGARVFAFGVGNDVNTRLLDKLAEEGRGDRDYVREDESIEVKTGALLAKVSHPVMTDVEILCDGITGFDVFPRRTPDLFKGSRLLVVGRYKGSGHHAVRLRGKVRGVRRGGTAARPRRAACKDSCDRSRLNSQRSRLGRPDVLWRRVRSVSSSWRLSAVRNQGR
ncbi:MAG: VIT domain-containing protein [Planctomycetota bacterium]